MAVRIRAVLLGSATAHGTEESGAQERQGDGDGRTPDSETRQQGRHSAELTRQLSTARRLVSSRVVDMGKRLGGFAPQTHSMFQMARLLSDQ